MKKILIIYPSFFFLVLFAASFSLLTISSSSAQGVWTWMSGDTISGSAGTYGIQGVPSVNNHPPNLRTSFSWTDLQGNFWLFGGYTTGSSNTGTYADMWKFNPGTLEWTWENGTSKLNSPAVLGTIGVPAANNTPGGRAWANCTWVDASGNLWLYGDNNLGISGDMWKYDITLNQWACMSYFDKQLLPVYGTQGVASALSTPGFRTEIANTWTDNNGKFWLYGGADWLGINMQSDMWMYDPLTNMWAWMSGSQSLNELPIYGNKGVFSPLNTPGGRWPYSAIKENNGNFLLFGGLGSLSTETGFADLWEYNPTINQWAWISGTQQTNVPAVKGNVCQSDSAYYPDARRGSMVWKDCAGNLWLFGGEAYNPLSTVVGDMWVYLTAEKKWTRMSDTNYAYTRTVFGTLGVSSLSNQPGPREIIPQWKDKNGNFWIFSGYSYRGFCADMWRYIPDYSCININCGCGATTGAVVSSRDSFCTNSGLTSILKTLGSTGNVQWQISSDSIHFADLPGDTTSTYSTPLTLSSTTYYRIFMNNDCGYDSSNIKAVHVLPSPVAKFTYIIDGNQVIFNSDSSSKATSYSWDFGDKTTSTLANPTHTFTGSDTFFVCLTVYNGANCSYTRCKTINLTTGVDNLTADNFIHLYPNPAEDKLTIEVQNGALPKRIEIFDVLGRSLLTIVPRKQDILINTNSFPAGTYFVHVQMNDGKRQVMKFVKE